MNKCLILLTAVLLVLNTTIALAQQPAELKAVLGYGTYSMRELKNMQASAAANTAVNAKVTDNFPAYFNYGLKYLFNSPVDDRYGLVAEVGSTGGRLAYADYSGSYREDLLLRYGRFGVVVESHRELPKGFTAKIGMELSVVFSRLVYEGELVVYKGGSVSETYTFVSMGGAVQPTIALERKVGPINLGLQAGASLGASEVFHLKDNRDAKLIDSAKDNEKISPNWNGLRVGFYVGVPLNKIMEDQ